MMKKSVTYENKAITLKAIIAGGIIGGVIGTLVILWTKFGILNFPVLWTFLTQSTLDEMILVPILGFVIGGVIGGLMALYIPQSKAESVVNNSNMNKCSSPQEPINNKDSNSKFQLKEEQLHIYKNLIKTGEVSVHKEVITKEKNITVPVICEELVIEKKGKGPTDTIRIPISEECVDISKHKVILEDVNIYKHHIEDTKHIEETLKKEKLNIKTTGDLKVNDIDTEKNS